MSKLLLSTSLSAWTSLYNHAAFSILLLLTPMTKDNGYHLDCPFYYRNSTAESAINIKEKPETASIARRCRTAGVECIFTNSRVGRVRGTRTKSNNNPITINGDTNHTSGNNNKESTINPVISHPPSHPPSADFLQNPTNWTEQEQHHSQNTTAMSTAPGFVNGINSTSCGGTNTYFPGSEIQSFELLAGSFSWANAPEDEDVDGADHLSVEASPSSDPTFSSLHDFQSPEGQLEFEPENNSHNPTSQPQPQPQRKERQPYPCHLPPIEQDTPAVAAARISSDTQCVLVCAELIGTLESYIAAHLAVLDIILELTNSVTERLQTLLNMHPGPAGYRFLALLAVILSQIIDLLEAGCATFLAEERLRTRHTSVLPMTGQMKRGGFTGGTGLGLTFGAFQIDANERRMKRFQVVSRELRATEKFLQRVMQLAGVHVENSGGGGDTLSDRARCFVDLDVRLTRLKNKISVREKELL
ncbi:hypothetical protein PISL3812_09128 [Talaromyces islandicus]|uniref:Uncharacterized protein n=1 Tax=Talaromyces islandicus TaxID=28573 RepID=A0A0U1M8U9_TALIS|nr:hypothetical protein PISL3812_09128 [Talaromyces islandicus]